MREIPAQTVIDAVAKLCIDANRHLPEDVKKTFADCAAAENSDAAREIFAQLTENYELAAKTGLPLCQDTGLAVLFVEVGEDVRVAGMTLREAINEGVRKGYQEGFLRKSVCDPLTRKNTGDNTPAIVHFDLVPGDRLKILFMAKGGGSENMSRVTMLSPAQGWEGIKKFVVQRVAEAGPNPCPPTVVGVGIGGDFELAAIIAKKALARKLDDVNPDPKLAEMEKELLEAINKLGIGPMGLGGKTTSLGVKIAMHPCHIASLPLAVNIQCHSARHEEVEL
ncbi:hydro-lyase, Fe-S type, tartrate/fumarate subfamily, alpha subunit [Alkalidesulfovibrio alkalitolerans DSM 16529]|jgi:fumarate hydratase subunit alpha|uniref:Hydro-lyase, Fe-S type, tartrate/fumarate subfamily, alpha subunit n=1 Tax=Alkalidesulfovibrio alkalitolerans DSM 16529 TaxID=1121439 RepID=S7UGN4_9BACT|nr:fumarate hydratase [Alkalidesulfovibrio alkalitolerans]EPR31398.1 hydro-lyase, Fe-S type, tartrate/fumarate subfamily, alpha subunit [Alkalidesulfovibrio alkalitolerans DSM 16529]